MTLALAHDTAKMKTRGATKTRMSGHEGPGLHYKHVRTTVELLRASTFYKQFNDDDRDAFEKLAEANYDISAAADIDLERLYAKLDDELMEKVRNEFEFQSDLGNIRDHGDHIAFCTLCGKGDSRDDKENRDKLRFDYRLTNLAGGQDVWCGSTCIINHALKVRGAETSEEARAILERSMREHMSMWRREQWRAENPEHESIPQQFSRFALLSLEFKRFHKYGRLENEIRALGKSQSSIFFTTCDYTRTMRGISRFYQRKGFLTPKKHKAWRESRAFLRSLSWLVEQLDYVLSTQMSYRERMLYLGERYEERKSYIERLRTTRNARPLD